MPATSVPTLVQVVSKRFNHSWARLHPVAFRQRDKAQPSINAPPVEAEMICDFSHCHARSLQPVDYLK